MVTYRQYCSVRRLTIISLIVLGLLLAVSCGDKKQEGPPNVAKVPELSKPDIARLIDFAFHADTLLPRELNGAPLTAPAETIIVRPKEAASYFDSAAGYLDYDFVGQAAARYNVDGVPVDVAISEFATLEDAFGFYSIHRPPGSAVETIGTESFATDTIRWFVKGPYVTEVSTDQASPASRQLLVDMAGAVSANISEQPGVSNYFILFPRRFRLEHSQRYYAYNYLDIGGLDQVYTTDFVIEGDTVTLFLTVDRSGEKYMRFQAYGATTTALHRLPPMYDYDKDYAISFRRLGYGLLVGGLARGKLVGFVGYQPETMGKFGTTWITGLQQ